MREDESNPLDGGVKPEKLTAEEQQAILEIENMVHEKLKDEPEHHGIKHTEDVRRLAREICFEEKGDTFATEVASLIHDLGRRTENEENRPHAILSLFEGHDYLKKLYEQGVIDIDTWRSISQAVAKHSRKNEENDRLTLNIVRDADRLDSMGLKGLKRSLQHAQSLDWPFYDSSKKIMTSRKEEVDRKSSKSGISNINFIRAYGNMLHLESAKEMAEPRLKVLEDFLALFEKHQDIKDYDFWIKFLERQIKQGKSSVSEEAFEEFMDEYNKEK